MILRPPAAHLTLAGGLHRALVIDNQLRKRIYYPARVCACQSLDKAALWGQ
jgi:hypothetical protein